jgi:hypothetical protein
MAHIVHGDPDNLFPGPSEPKAWVIAIDKVGLYNG